MDELMSAPRRREAIIIRYRDLERLFGARVVCLDPDPESESLRIVFDLGEMPPHEVSKNEWRPGLPAYTRSTRLVVQDDQEPEDGIISLGDTHWHRWEVGS